LEGIARDVAICLAAWILDRARIRVTRRPAALAEDDAAGCAPPEQRGD
jgi:hypothetical protein